MNTKKKASNLWTIHWILVLSIDVVFSSQWPLDLNTRFHAHVTRVQCRCCGLQLNELSQLRIKDLQSLSIYMQVIVCLSLSVSVFVSVNGTKNVRALPMVPKMFGFFLG